MDTGDGADINEDDTPRVSGLSASRLAQLRSDMLLTPEQRVLAAEETLNLDRLREANIPRRVIGFDRYEDYLDYKWRASTGGA
jgi:hypothetical protein